MKKNMIFSGAMSMMTALLLCTACSSDDVTTNKATAAVPEGKVIHYTATVGEGDETRATLNSSKKYEFQTGDKLVITGTNISGDLTLATGAGTASATFSGDLNYTGGDTPDDDLVLKAVLVSSASESAGMTLTYDEATYPETAVASTLAEAVEKYSHFIGTSTYGEKNFKVSQQTSFLNFTVTFGEGTSSSGELDITIKNDNETVRTGSVTAATGGSNAVARFVAAMPAGTTMSSATVKLGSNSAISFGGTTTLVANKIYNISKNVGRFAVDLGLSVKWANMNVGATSETEYGDYFAWGETEPYYSSQDPLTWKDGKEAGYADDCSNYKWCNGSYLTITKYNNDEDFGTVDCTVDNKTTLESTDDAATANWGGNWRMPTYDELEELVRTCPQYGGSKEKISGYSWEWQSDYQGSGHAGYLITVTKECAQKGNSIFLPAAGYGENELLDWQGDSGSYWSSTLNENVRCAWCLDFYSEEVYMGSDVYRYLGCTVRPVQEY